MLLQQLFIAFLVFSGTIAYCDDPPTDDPKKQVHKDSSSSGQPTFRQTAGTILTAIGTYLVGDPKVTQRQADLDDWLKDPAAKDGALKKVMEDPDVKKALEADDDDRLSKALGLEKSDPKVQKLIAAYNQKKYDSLYQQSQTQLSKGQSGQSGISTTSILRNQGAQSDFFKAQEKFKNTLENEKASPEERGKARSELEQAKRKYEESVAAAQEEKDARPKLQDLQRKIQDEIKHATEARDKLPPDPPQKPVGFFETPAKTERQKLDERIDSLTRLQSRVQSYLKGDGAEGPATALATGTLQDDFKGLTGSQVTEPPSPDSNTAKEEKPEDTLKKMSPEDLRKLFSGKETFGFTPEQIKRLAETYVAGATPEQLRSIIHGPESNDIRRELAEKRSTEIEASNPISNVLPPSMTGASRAGQVQAADQYRTAIDNAQRISDPTERRKAEDAAFQKYRSQIDLSTISPEQARALVGKAQEFRDRSVDEEGLSTGRSIVARTTLSLLKARAGMDVKPADANDVIGRADKRGDFSAEADKAERRAANFWSDFDAGKLDPFYKTSEGRAEILAFLKANPDIANSDRGRRLLVQAGIINETGTATLRGGASGQNYVGNDPKGPTINGGASGTRVRLSDPGTRTSDVLDQLPGTITPLQVSDKVPASAQDGNPPLALSRLSGKLESAKSADADKQIIYNLFKKDADIKGQLSQLSPEKRQQVRNYLAQQLPTMGRGDGTELKRTVEILRAFRDMGTSDKLAKNATMESSDQGKASWTPEKKSAGIGLQVKDSASADAASELLRKNGAKRSDIPWATLTPSQRDFLSKGLTDPNFLKDPKNDKGREELKRSLAKQLGLSDDPGLTLALGHSQDGTITSMRFTRVTFGNKGFTQYYWNINPKTGDIIESSRKVTNISDLKK